MGNMAETLEPPCTFEQKLEALLPKMMAHAMVITKAREPAEELVQDTCVRALSCADQHREKDRFDGWIGAIMHSVWSNKRRSLNRRSVEEELDDPDSLPGSMGDNPADGFERRSIISDMKKVLSDDDFLLIIKVHLYGYSYRELAEEAGLPIGTVLSRVSRAKAALVRANEKIPDETGTVVPLRGQEGGHQHAV